MTSLKQKGIVLNKVTIVLILFIEALIFLFLSVYKYYINFSSTSLISVQFFRVLYRNYDLFYIGNIIVILLMLLSLVSCIKLFIESNRVREGTLRLMLLFQFVTLLFLILSLVISKEAFDEFTGKIIQLDTRGLKVLSLSIFIGLKLFCTISLIIISFSVLKKLYLIRAIWFSMIVSLLIIIIVFFSVNNYKDDTDEIKTMKDLDAGVILGAAVWGGNRPSPILRERINKGYELYKEKKINKIVLTGGGSKGEKTEAEVSRQELIKKGVPKEDIYIENQSNSTLQQISYISRNLYKANSWNELIMISDNFHLYRTKQICSFFSINCLTVSSDTPLSAESGFNFSLKETFAVIIFWLFGIG